VSFFFDFKLTRTSGELPSDVYAPVLKTTKKQCERKIHRPTQSQILIVGIICNYRSKYIGGGEGGIA